MKWVKNLVGFGIIGLAVFFSIKSSCQPEVVTPPTIVTQYDTVEKIDTIWKTKLVKETKWDTIVTERVVVAKPETVFTNLTFSGITTIKVGRKAGDTTKVLGATVKVDSVKTIERWETNYWTLGPLEAVTMDSTRPKIAFYDTKKGCNTVCLVKTGLYIVGSFVILKEGVKAAF